MRDGAFADNSRPGAFPMTAWKMPFPAVVKPMNGRLTLAEFEAFCAENRDLRIEMDKNQTLLIMPPVDIDGGIAEGKVYGYLFAWWLKTDEPGKVFSPTTGFRLPDGSVRSADGAWVTDKKFDELSLAERKKFASLVPDFVIELRSSSDRISVLKKKMVESWMKNGVRLAWLLDPQSEKSWIYRAGCPVEALTGFDRLLSGEAVCIGFELDLRKLRV